MRLGQASGFPASLPSVRGESIEGGSIAACHVPARTNRGSTIVVKPRNVKKKALRGTGIAAFCRTAVRLCGGGHFRLRFRQRAQFGDDLVIQNVLHVDSNPNGRHPVDHAMIHRTENRAGSVVVDRIEADIEWRRRSENDATRTAASNRRDPVSAEPFDSMDARKFHRQLPENAANEKWI